VFPLERGDGVGFSIDRFGANTLEQDRLEVAFGKSFGATSFLHALRVGVDLSFLRQQFTLIAPLPGINPSNVSAEAFSIGAGVLYDPFAWATLGLSADNLSQPNLGVVGTDTVPILVRYGLAVRPPVGQDKLLLTLAQSVNNGVWDTQGGAEWNLIRWGSRFGPGEIPIWESSGLAGR